MKQVQIENIPGPFKLALHAYMTVKFYSVIDFFFRFICALLMIGIGLILMLY